MEHRKEDMLHICILTAGAQILDQMEKLLVQEWLPDHSRKITNRYFYDGKPVPNGGHNTGEFVEPIGEGTFLPPKPEKQRYMKRDGKILERSNVR